MDLLSKNVQLFTGMERCTELQMLRVDVMYLYALLDLRLYGLRKLILLCMCYLELKGELLMELDAWRTWGLSSE